MLHRSSVVVTTTFFCAVAVCTTALCTTPAAAQGWNTSHAPQDLRSFVAATYGGRSFVSVSQVYRAVRAKGWLNEKGSATLLKRQLRMLAKSGGRSSRFLDLRVPVLPPTANPGPVAAVAETEYNDSEAYANDFGAIVSPVTATGVLTGNADTDTFRFTLVLDSVVTFTTTASGGQSSLMITSANGDESWGYHFYDASKMVTPLPAGTYHAVLGGSSLAVTYSMVISPKFQAIPTLPFGQTTQLATGTDPVAVKLVLPQDGRVNLKLTTSNAVNSFLIVQNARWGYVYDVDDASTSSSNGDAGLDAQLPQGTYYVYVWADSSATTSVAATFSSGATPLLGASANGVLAGSQESFDLYRVVTTSMSRVDLRLSGNGTTQITDSYLVLYDRNMVQILEGDDDVVTTQGLLSAVLPAGTYYVASHAYWDAGGYSITKSTAAGSTSVAQAGINPGSIAADSTGVFRYSAGTPQWVEIDVVQGSGFDAQVGVVDAKTGLALSWEDDENMGPQDANLGVYLPTGDYLVMVKEYGGIAGSFDARILPPLQRWVNDNVMVRGHAGNPLYFLLAAKPAAPSNPLPGLIKGNLLLDLSSAIIIPLGMPPGGMIDFQTSLKPNSGAFLQMVDVDAATLLGVYSNLLR